MKSKFIAFNTIVIKEILRFTRIWSQTLLPSAMTSILYFMIFGSLIGKRIGEMHGYPYMQFIAPGLIMMAVINNAYANVSSSFFSMRFMHSINELLIAPIPNPLIILGYVAGGVLRAAISGLLVTIVALFFTHLHMHHLGVTLLVMLLSSMLFGVAGFINAIFSKRFDSIMFVPTFVLTPLIYLGGVFYSIQLLSPFWRSVSLANPILYIVNAFRYGILGVSDVSVFASVSMIFVFAVAGFLIALALLNRGIGIKE